MDTQTLKLQCLRMATEKMPLPDSAKITEVAEAYWRWLTSVSASPEQQPDIQHTP